MPWTFSQPVPIWRRAGSKSISGANTKSSGGGGSVATTTVSGGAVSGASIQSGGTGYTIPPVVVFSGGGGTGATGEAVLTDGVVTGITITNPGTGYTSPPTVTISPVLISEGDYYGPQFIITTAFGPAVTQKTATYNLDTAASTILFTVSGLIQRPSGLAPTTKIGLTIIPVIIPTVGVRSTTKIGASIIQSESGDVIESLLFDLEFEDGKDVIELEIFT